MKKLILFILLFYFSCKLIGQITFNQRYHFNTLATYLTSIIPTDSCYYATGIYADTLPFLQVGSLFMKMDLEGNPVFVKKLISPEKSYETWFNDLTALPDGNFAVQAFSVDTTAKTMLIKFNNDGDTLFTKEYLSPLYPNYYFIQPRGGFSATPDGGFVFSNWINTNGGSDIFLIKTDSLGNKQWGKFYGNSMWDRPQSLIVTPEGKIIAGGIRTNDNTALENYTYRCHIFQVDSAGNVEWDYLSPNGVGFLRDAANDMVLLDDGSLVVASGVGTEYDRPSVNVVWFEKLIFKLNPNNQVEWEREFIGSRPTSYTTLNNIIDLSDGSGFVASGITPKPINIPTGDNWISEGWIGKVSTNGDSLWAREYVGIESVNSRHQIIDLKETADGGFILCGESRNPDADSIPQQAWLLKLDEYGCLVPGCYTATEEPAGGEPAISLAIYPNPASDYLNFYLRTPRPVREASFRIVNAEGRLMKAFQSDRPDATFIVPVWDWVAGVYFLQYVEEGVVRASEKFIVSSL
jgi:Secretion system C-terminal sorting domain